MWAIVLVVSLPTYILFESSEHFVWHFVFGAGSGALLLVVYERLRGRRVAGPPGPTMELAMLRDYVYRIVPEAIYSVPRALGHPVYEHEPWMDVFLLHPSFDTGSTSTPPP